MFGGFSKPEQECRYNDALFELIHALATRFTASLNTSKPQINQFFLRDSRKFCTVHKRSEVMSKDSDSLQEDGLHGRVQKEKACFQ